MTLRDGTWQTQHDLVAWLYRVFLRPLLFLLPAEAAHGFVAFWLRWAHRNRTLRAMMFGRHARPEPLRTTLLGRTYSSPVGLAAGFDKSAEMYNALGAMGFGSVEVGTLTAIAQPGNPRPRLFRLPRDRALINRMGFNNPGAARGASAIREHPPEAIVLGVNVGKSKVTPLDGAADDYARSVRLLAPLAHYLVVNVSSPNTPGLRSLQSVEALNDVIDAVQTELGALRDAAPPPPPPLFVKIAPDLSDDDIDAIVDLACARGLAGLIATNTTISREGLSTPRDVVDRLGAGGLSGPALGRRAREVVSRVFRRAAGRLGVLGVGGSSGPDDAWEMLRAGASLVQLYTGLIYGGPRLVREIEQGLIARLAARGIANIREIVGETAAEYEGRSSETDSPGSARRPT